MMRLHKVINQYLSSKEIFLYFCYRYMAATIPSNCVISPYHMQTLISLMLFAGEGEAMEEIREKLGVIRSLERIRTSASNFLQACQMSEDGCSGAVTSYIRVNHNFPTEHDFRFTANCYFKCTVETTNFTELNPLLHRNIIKLCDLDESTKVILECEVSFKSNWTNEFRLHGQLGFHGDAGAVPVPSLRSRGFFNYSDHRQFDAELIEIGLKGDLCSMVIVLPHHINGLSVVEDKIEQILNFSNYQRRFLDLHLPMFRSDTHLNFKSLLEELGVERIFSQGSADLNKMFPGENDHFVNDVVQWNIFRVTEFGITIDQHPLEYTDHLAYQDLRAVPADSISPQSVVINHPFVFYVKYQNVILYVGRIVEHRIIPRPADD